MPTFDLRWTGLHCIVSDTIILACVYTEATGVQDSHQKGVKAGLRRADMLQASLPNI